MKKFNAMPSSLTVRKEFNRGSRTFAPGDPFRWHGMALCLKSVRNLIGAGFLDDPFADATETETSSSVSRKWTPSRNALTRPGRKRGKRRGKR